MPKASEIKRGDVVDIEGVPHVLKHLETKSPIVKGRGNALQIAVQEFANRLKKRSE